MSQIGRLAREPSTHSAQSHLVRMQKRQVPLGQGKEPGKEHQISIEPSKHCQTGLSPKARTPSKNGGVPCGVPFESHQLDGYPRKNMHTEIYYALQHLMDPPKEKELPLLGPPEMAGRQNYVPKMDPGKWKLGLQPAVPWWFEFEPHPNKTSPKRLGEVKRVRLTASRFFRLRSARTSGKLRVCERAMRHRPIQGSEAPLKGFLLTGLSVFRSLPKAQLVGSNGHTHTHTRQKK